MFNRKLCYEEKSNVFISALESKIEEPTAQETGNEFATEEKNITNVNYFFFLFIFFIQTEKILIYF